MFVSTPSILNSQSARYARFTTSAKSEDGEWAMSFARRESKRGLVVYPT